MSGYKLKAGCHCGNITAMVELTSPPSTLNPRACDCDFCRKHGAAYVSDPKGKLTISVREPELLGKYHQGSGTADFLFCRQCGVLVGVSFQQEQNMYATINARIIENAVFGDTCSASPKKLSTAEKIARWQTVWFSHVSINA
ncbi:glutathione-dependent formaldehyde-activating GFA [Tolumonas auensis DSM 9187]|uniref:Glutathione-dependent formaldehyde-activating GFA n=1 Tax=Tolumonas auensis (strain DSM 9187 / NBRC 110442 / TA 4) TaxID=595494 RepID=C4LAW9_TOLAT|nr:aldehyde-activating protein [Tolumonas auensis]ACQ92323.1 glutathione-dependent formaldehyde-activating GFA [Tolumonas auensis DSM 9187]